MNTTTRVLGVGLALCFVTVEASAQGSLLEEKKATTGTTDVAAAGFQKAEESVASEIHETTGKLTAGGMFATGNARSLAVTGGGSVRVRRGSDQYSADLAINYGRSAASADEDIETTVENYQARVRYDRFLSKRWALFAQLTGRRDRFQQLDLRTNFDPGAAYYFLIQETQHLTFEAGYDLQYDIRNTDSMKEAAAAGAPLDATAVRHAARVAIGYDNSINEHVTFETDLEYLQAFEPTEAFRINWITYLSAKISTNFAVAAGFTLRYDNYPLPGVQKLDTLTTMNLVYNLQ
jgi:putative salt-induced outer membrane protein